MKSKRILKDHPYSNKKTSKELEKVIHKIRKNQPFGYHKRMIQKGILGNFSKIKEEFEEAEDSFEQKNPIMVLNELSDLIGSIEAYAKNYNITLEDLIKMKDATKRAFETGRRA